MVKRSKKKDMRFAVISIVVVIALLAVAFSYWGGAGKETGSLESNAVPSVVDEVVGEEVEESLGDEEAQEEVPAETGLSSYLLTDVVSGDEFYIKADVPIVLKTFAVWCPTCLRQQNEIKKLHDMIGDDALSIALNTDPNEDAETVRDHVVANGFDWHFAVAPTELTKELIDQFGNRIVSAPSAPVVIICPDMTYNFLGRGLKSAEKLQEELAFCDGGLN